MRSHFLCICILALTGCPTFEVQRDPDVTVLPVDQDIDNDGVSMDIDCDDSDASIGGPTAWYLDLDGDSFGDSNVSEDACEAWDRYVAIAGDCNDQDAGINPSAIEVCDDVDNDCEGTIDEGASDATAWFADADQDSYGDVENYVTACDQPDGYIGDWSDCDDANPAVNPGESEVCDEIDQNCNGEVDEGVQSTYFADVDGDSFGDAESSADACLAPSGYVEDATDCNDGEASVNPSATEVCNGIDDDCEGTIDEGASDASTWYSDVDGDGFGDVNVSEISCEASSGFVSDSADCNDTDASVNPSAIETCDNIDNDCDGAVDPSTSVGTGTWYVDDDNDGWGDSSGTPVVQCTQPDGYLADASDCDDSDATVNPSGTEVCDGIDNNCDGSTDPDDSADVSTWYADLDGDAFGNASVSSVSCEADPGFVADATDCDDTESSVNPSATEVCNEVDDDCDSAVDEDVEITFYGDWDNDGYGNSAVTESACEASAGYVSDGSDCDDTKSAVNPGASEVCDEIDDDCDGLTDDQDDSTDESTMSEFYADADADTYGDASSSYVSCEAPDGYVEDATDCDDGDVGSYPDAPETCDLADNDCDGSVDENLYSDWYEDLDGDLFGAGAVVSVICNGSTGNLVDNADDCDDNESGTNPDATEVCDEIDNNCDGDVDEGVETTYYQDADGDSYGDASTSDDACEAPSGYVEDSTDCDDADASVNPGVAEIDANGIDDDCDGGIDDEGIYCCLDNDSDGYGDPSYCEYEGTGVCDSGYVEGDGDCEDHNYAVHPLSLDIPGDGEDSDCDGDTEG